MPVITPNLDDFSDLSKHSFKTTGPWEFPSKAHTNIQTTQHPPWEHSRHCGLGNQHRVCATCGTLCYSVYKPTTFNLPDSPWGWYYYRYTDEESELRKVRPRIQNEQQKWHIHMQAWGSEGLENVIRDTALEMKALELSSGSTAPVGWPYPTFTSLNFPHPQRRENIFYITGEFWLL